MADDRAKLPETEKITLNLGFVDLGRIDLLVREGFYSNRSDLIRTAIRNHLDRHDDDVKRAVQRADAHLGLRRIAHAELEAARAGGEMLALRVLGLVSIDSDVSPDLARATIASLSVLGALHASAAVKAAVADRIE